MALSNRIEEFLAMIEARKCYLSYNFEIMDIVDGNLFKYVDRALGVQLSGQPLAIARERIPPINVLGRIINKLSKIYTQGVIRNVNSGTEKDSQMLSWYERKMKINMTMQTANRYFNMFKNCLIQPYLSTIKGANPAIRVIPSDRFLPFSDSKDEREKPTGYVLIIGPGINSKRKPTMVYMAINDYEYVYFNSEKEILTALYTPENPEGINELGRMPFVYINRDEKSILPTQNSDTVKMTTLIPVLLTDINFAHMFQSFSLIYTVNVKDGDLKFAPNAIWQFSTEPGSDQKPEIGTITPSSDINGGLNLVANQFALWLNTLGIKPGEIGEVNGSNFASGIAKMLDELDTSEDRKEQIPYFSAAEEELWDLILNYMHPAWENQIEFKGKFSPGAYVTVNFAEQVPLIRRGAVVSEQKTEVDSGFTTRKIAIQRINPHLSDTQVDELISSVDSEQSAASSTALNGSQVESMVAVIEKVGLGIIPKESGKSILISSFGLSEESAGAIIDPISEGSIKSEDVSNAV